MESIAIMTLYTLRYKCTTERTDFEFMVSCKIELPFHPNITDDIMAWDDFHQIEKIELILGEEFIIELKHIKLLWQGSRDKTLEHIKEELQEMIECGWILEPGYSSIRPSNMIVEEDDNI